MSYFHRILVCLAVAAGTAALSAGELVWRLGDTAGTTLAPAAGRTGLRFSAPPVLEKNAAHPELSGVRFSPELPGEAAADSSPETDLTDDFALEVTCRPDAVDHYRTILWKGDRSVKPERIAYYLSIHDGKLEFKFKDAAGEWCVFSTSEAVIAPGLWHRIAVQVKNGRPAFSVDGRLLPSGDGYAGRAPLKRLESNRDKLYIGRGRAGAMPAYGFCGVIGSVRLTAPAAKTVLRTSSGDRLRRLGIRDDFERESARLRRLEPLMKAGRISGDPARLAEEGAAIAALLAKGDFSAAAAAVSGWKRELDRFEAERRELEDQAAYAELFRDGSRGGAFALFTMPTGLTFRRDSGFYRLLTPAAPVELKAARGETESFQLLPGAGTEPLSVGLAFSGFAAADGTRLAESSVHWGEIRDITAERTDLGNSFSGPPSPEFTGSWPDLIIEENPAEIKVPAGSVTPVFFRVSVPRDAKPGRYEGTVVVSAPSGKMELPVSLLVRSFELPRRNSIPVVFSFFPDFYKEWYDRKTLTAAEREAINRFLADYRIPPNNIYANGLCPDLETIAEFDLGFATAGYFLYEEPLSAGALDELAETFRRRLKPVTDSGLQDRVYLYSFDEISLTEPGRREKRYEAARQIMRRFAKEFPYLKRLQTSEPVPELLDCFNVWCPQFPYFKGDNPMIGRVRDGGGEFWWYSADAPYKPYPNFFLGYPLTDLRVIMSMTWQKNVRGILYWCVNREWRTNLDIRDRWPADNRAWKPSIVNIFTGATVCRNGMGNLVYPGPEGKLYASLRLENLRDGIEDYEYYALLKRRTAELRRVRPDSPLIAEAEAALQVPADVAVDIDQYSHRPEPLMRRHDRLGDLIERIQTALAAQGR